MIFYSPIKLYVGIQYECYSAPLQFDGVEYSWWNDRNGNEQYYWHGSDNSTHMCLCGIANMCADPNKNCNCDADVPINLVDEGMLKKRIKLILCLKYMFYSWIYHI